MSKPLAIDLCCGLGGWTEGLLAEQWDCVGFDIEQHAYGDNRYPAQLVIQDILTINGRQFRGKVQLIVASPPCQFFSYTAMPWSRAKKLAAEVRADPVRLEQELALFNACVRIGKEAECPTVIENVRGAQPWVGRGRAAFGSFVLWGDVPALMPMTAKRPAFKGGDRNIGRADGEHKWNTEFKVPGFRFDGSGKSFQSESVVRQISKGWRDKHYGETEKASLQDDGVKQGGDWFNASQPSISRMCGSKSNARKAASAQIAKIPFALSSYIARTFYPR